MVEFENFDLLALVDGIADDPRWLGAVGSLVLVALVVRALERRAGRPRRGEVWFACVPYRDGTGSKDRPVLVLSTSGRTCVVAQFTSRDRDERRDHRRVPDGIPGLSRSSWVSLRPVRVPRSAMRRRAGTPGLALVTWYESVGAH